MGKICHLILTLVILASPLAAWSGEGHVLVGEIALDNMKPPLRSQLNELLSHHPDPNVRTLSQASVWPDQIKDPGHPFHLYHRPDWHYEDRLVSDYSGEVSLEGDIVAQIERHRRVVANRNNSPGARAVSLSWLVHLVGDIHQPLHNSEFYDHRFPKGDKGGNLFMVILGRQAISLHYLWDTAGGRFLDPPSPQRLRSYQKWFQESYPPDSMPELAVANYETWADEGLSEAIESYRWVELGEPINSEALANILNVSGYRITLAGYRLAALMERTLR